MIADIEAKLIARLLTNPAPMSTLRWASVYAPLCNSSAAAGCETSCFSSKNIRGIFAFFTWHVKEELTNKSNYYRKSMGMKCLMKLF